MFLHLSVSHSVHGGSASVHAGIHTFKNRANSCKTPPPEQTPPGQTPLCSACWEIHMATAADGTHPTGMHSSWTKFQMKHFYQLLNECRKK